MLCLVVVLRDMLQALLILSPGSMILLQAAACYSGRTTPDAQLATVKICNS